MTGQTLNLQGVARYIGVSRRNLYDQIRDGRFPVQPIQGTKPRRWSIAALDQWMNAGSAAE